MLMILAFRKHVIAFQKTSKTKQKSPLRCVKKWLQGNKLFLNVVKTQAMFIGARPNLKKIDEKKAGTSTFSIEGSGINLVNNMKYFGAQLDHRVPRKLQPPPPRMIWRPSSLASFVIAKLWRNALRGRSKARRANKYLSALYIASQSQRKLKRMTSLSLGGGVKKLPGVPVT